MPDTVENTETGEQNKPLENNANPPVVQTPDAGEAEKLRKELEQSKMRTQQLENEKKQREEAEAKLQAKKLEENNEFKTLYEQERAKREEAEAERAADLKAKSLEEAKTTVLADYSDEVKTLAEEAGMALTDSDEASISAYKEKLDKVSKLVGATQKVGPNNPNRTENKVEYTPDELKLALKDPAKFHEIVMQRPGIATMSQRRNIAV